jgi:MFS family permease
MRTSLPPQRQGHKLWDGAAWKCLPYVFFNLGLFFEFIGLYIPLFYIIAYAENAGVGESISFYLLPIMNAASVFGRIIPDLLADRFGPLSVLVSCLVIAIAMAYAWIGIPSLTGGTGLVVFAIFLGLSTGAVVSLQLTIISSMVPMYWVLGWAWALVLQKLDS